MKIAAILFVLFAHQAFATGLATCDSGDKKSWKPDSELKTQLEQKGWQVRRIKEDGGCYEVYAIDENGERTEAYFHPVTFERIPVEEH
jgi:hypothetical protein